MMLVRFRNSEDSNHFLKKLKKMKTHFEDMIECLEEKIEKEESYDEDYDEEIQYRGGGSSYRGDTDYRGGRYRYRRGM